MQAWTVTVILTIVVSIITVPAGSIIATITGRDRRPQRARLTARPPLKAAGGILAATGGR